MTSLKKKKSGLDVKPILKDKDKENKGLELQLVPEYVDKRAFQQGNHNPNYVFAGALYIPKDIIQLVSANDTGAGKIYMGPIKNEGNVFDSDDQMVEIEDPDIRKYVIRILRYFKYDPEEAMSTLREASFKIKNRARGIVKRTHSQNTVTKLQAWRAKIHYSEIIRGSEEELLNTQSNSIFPLNVQNIPLNEEEDKDEYVYDGGHEEVNKQSFIQRTLTRLFSTKSTTKIDKSQKEISSSGTNGSYYSEGEKSSSKTNRWKAKKSKSLSQLRNERNKQVTGLLSSVTTDPNEKIKKNQKPNLKKIISRKIKNLITILKTIYYKKSNVDNKEAKHQTDFIYSDMYFNYQGASIKKSSLTLETYQLKQEELLLNYLTTPRIHHFGTYTVMPLRIENPHIVRSHHRKKALKRMKKRLQSIETFPFRSFEAGQFCDPCSMFSPTLQNENCPRFDKVLPKQQRFACSKPRFETYSMVDKRTNDRHKSKVTRQSVDIIADTFVDVIDSPNDPKCKVEITGHGYKGKFNVGLDPIIDEVLYNSLQNLKETYENSRFSNDTRGFDKRRNNSLASIAYNVRDYLKSKVTGRNPIRNNISDQFSSENVIGRTSIHREETDIYRENSPQIICEDTNVKHRRYRHNLNRKYPPSTKISRYFEDNEKYKCKPNCHKQNNPRREKKKRTINSSGSESFEERQFIRKTRDPMPQVLESSDDSFIIGETNSTLDESTRFSNTGGSTTNDENKKGPLKTRAMRNQNYSTDLSYISEKDWRAAAELLRREKEGSMFSTDKSEPVKYMSLNEYEGEKSDNKNVQNSSTGNSKIVKVKETMTTTANGVTTVTQTEVIEAINQSSQCLFPSTSEEAFVGRKDFNVMPLTTRKEELGGRLAKVFQHTPEHRKLHEEVPFKRGINDEVVSNRNKENPQKLRYSNCPCPRELRCHEVIDEKKYFNGTEKLLLTSPQDRNRNNDIINHNAELQIQNDMRKKGHCYCNPHSANTYTLSKEMTTTSHVETTDFSQEKLREPKRKFSVLHKVNSDPINICVIKPNFLNYTKGSEDKMHIRENAISKVERENPSFRSKQDLQEKIPLENSWEQVSKMPEEVICTQSGAAKIRVSLGSCDTNHRQQVYLELMKVLKHKLESENQLLNNDATTHAVKFCDLEDYTTLKGFQGNTTPYSKKKIEKETFGKINETATLMPLATETCSQRMHLLSGALKNCNISTKKRKCITTCHRPCLCNEKRNGIASQAAAEKIVSKQKISSDSLLLNKEDIPKPSVKYRKVSISVQSDDLVEPTTSVDIIPKEVSITEAPTPTKLEEKHDNPEMVSTSTQTEDLEARSSPKTSLNKRSLSSPKPSMTKRSSSLPKSNITKQSLSSGKRRASSPLPRESSTRKSRPKIKTGSLFSKSFSEKSSIQASRWRPSELLLSEKIPEEPRKPSIPETIKEDMSRKSTLHESENHKSSSLSSKRESTLSKRGSLFVRRSTPSSLYNSARSHQSSVISQRVWIQNLKVPMKSDSEAEIKKEKITESSKASAVHNLNNVSSSSPHSSETENSIVNSGWKRMPSRKSNKRDFVLHDPENNDSSQKETSMKYCSPKQKKNEKYIAAHVRKASHNSGVVGSVSFVPFQKSSSILEINTQPNYVEEIFSKLTMEPSVIYSGDSDTSSVISKCAKGSIVSSETLKKSNCSLLSFENSPLPVDYVENFEHLPSALSVNSNNSRNISTEKKFFKRHIKNSKPMLYGRDCITALNETKKPSPVCPDNCDSISLHCFTETNDEDIKMAPHSSLKIKKHPSNLVSGCTTLEVKPTVSPDSKIFRGKKKSTSDSSDSKTTVISRPTVCNNRLAVSLLNFISKPTGGTLEPPRSNNSSNSSKRKKGSSIDSVEFSGRKNSVKNRCKRSFMGSDQPNLRTIQNPPVVRTVSSDDADFYDASNPIPDCIQSDTYSTDPSRSQKPIKGQKKGSDGSEVILEKITLKHCKTEDAKLRKHKWKPKIEKIAHSALHNHSINSTLCIYDKTDENAEEIESDEANRTTIGFDCSNVSLKKDSFKVTKCYKHRAIDDTIRSSTAWIVKSSDSDLGTTENYAKYINKRSKSIEKDERKYQTTDLWQSSSELLEQRKKSNKRRIFVHTKRSYKTNKF